MITKAIINRKEAFMLPMITGAAEGAAIFYEIDNDIRAKEREKRFWQHWFDWFRTVDETHICTDWHGPKKDAAIRLDVLKMEFQKQIGYF